MTPVLEEGIGSHDQIKEMQILQVNQCRIVTLFPIIPHIQLGSVVRKGEDVGKDAAHHSSKDRDGGPYVKTRRKLLNHVVDGLRIQEREGIAERNLDFL